MNLHLLTVHPQHISYCYIFFSYFMKKYFASSPHFLWIRGKLRAGRGRRVITPISPPPPLDFLCVVICFFPNGDISSRRYFLSGDGVLGWCLVLSHGLRVTWVPGYSHKRRVPRHTEFVTKYWTPTKPHHHSGTPSRTYVTIQEGTCCRTEEVKRRGRWGRKR